MYEIYEVGYDLYQIHSKMPGVAAKEGSLLALGIYLTHVLKFNPEELEAALFDMLDYGHDSAQFGINKTYLFSFNKNKKVA